MNLLFQTIIGIVDIQGPNDLIYFLNMRTKINLTFYFTYNT